VKLGKPERFALGLGALVAAIVVCSGFGPNSLPPPQAQPFPARARVLPAPPPIQSYSQFSLHLGIVENLIWGLTNDIRRQHGLSPVKQEAALSTVSQAYSMDMLNRHFFSHTNPEGLTAGERLKPFCPGSVYGWGENIWKGSNYSIFDHESLARSIINSWMSSSGHRQNLLNPDYTHMGVGVAISGREIRATQLFATFQPR
jgi:uncharacterized protein YkwD